MKKRFWGARARGPALPGSPARARHSFALFDQTKLVTLKEAVKAVRWTHPQSGLQVQVVHPAGQAEPREMVSAASEMGRRIGRAAILKALSLGIFALSLAAALPAAAQMPSPAPESIKGVPLSPVRLPDGHPNWTGFWVPAGGFLEVYHGPSGVTDGPGARGANVAGPPRRDGPVLKSPYKEQYEERIKMAAAGTLSDPTAACLPPGMPAMMGMIYGMEILQTPKIIAITSEWQAESRRIWMDQKAHPPAEELDDTYAGHSIGHWEGDTLVVDTVGIRPDLYLQRNLLPHSPKMRITERFTQFSPGVLVDDITTEDPDAFETPLKSRQVYTYKPNLSIREYTCLENNRNVGPDGRAVF